LRCTGAGAVVSVGVGVGVGESGCPSRAGAVVVAEGVAVSSATGTAAPPSVVSTAVTAAVFGDRFMDRSGELDVCRGSSGTSRV